jgi:hypothetical protein
MSKKNRIRSKRARRTRGAVRKLGVILRDGRSVAVRLFKTKTGPQLQFREKWSRRPSTLSLVEAARIAERLRTGSLFTDAELTGGSK